MEKIDNREQISEPNFETYVQIINETYATENETLAKAFEAVRVEYGETFGNHKLENLFSADSNEIFRPTNPENPAYDAEHENWKRRQIKSITQLCLELNEASGSPEADEIAYNLVDYLVNI